MPEGFENKEIPRIFLSEPTTAAKESYLEAAKEFVDAKEWDEEDVKKIEKNFAGWVEELKGKTSEDNAQEESVPQNTFWLFSGDKYIGSIRIRRQLTDNLRRVGCNIGYSIRPSERRRGYATEMLGMALQKAAEFGLSEVLITCDEDNVGSQKVIEANGGQLLDSNVRIDEWPVPIRRYKIILSPTKISRS